MGTQSMILLHATPMSSHVLQLNIDFNKHKHAVSVPSDGTLAVYSSFQVRVQHSVRLCHTRLGCWTLPEDSCLSVAGK